MVVVGAPDDIKRACYATLIFITHVHRVGGAEQAREWEPADYNVFFRLPHHA